MMTMAGVVRGLVEYTLGLPLTRCDLCLPGMKDSYKKKENNYSNFTLTTLPVH